MYTDALNLFSDAQALTVTADSTNVIDLGVDRNVGQGEPLAVVIQTDVAADFTTEDEDYTVQIETDSVEAMSSARIIQSRNFVTANAAELAAGTKIVMALGHDNERYIQLSFVLAGTTPTWTVTAYLVPMSMIQADEKYADAITIS